MLCSFFTIGLALVSGADPTGQIAFLSGTAQADLCVCVLDVATGATTRVGTGVYDGAPVWSPDGAWLAFPSQRGEGVGIRLVRADGSEGRRLPHTHAWNRWPRWSPDGMRLVYCADDGAALGPGLMVYDLGTDTETTWAGGQTGILRPVWAGGIKFLLTLKQIGESAFGESAMAGLVTDFQETGALLGIGLVGEPGAYSTDLFLASKSGAVPLMPAALKRGDYMEWAVESNRKGNMIAFESNDGGDREVFVLSKLGMMDVSNHRAADWNPSWSPDGEWLAFESFRSGRRGIYRVYPETVRVFTVAASSESDNWHPTWSPDGKWLAFVSDRTGDPELHVTGVAAKGCRQLTAHLGPDLAPAWRPEDHR